MVAGAGVRKRWRRVPGKGLMLVGIRFLGHGDINSACTARCTMQTPVLSLPGLAHSGDSHNLRDPWRHHPAGCQDLLQHLPGQSQPHQPDHSKGHPDTDAECDLCMHGTTGCESSQMLAFSLKIVTTGRGLDQLTVQQPLSCTGDGGRGTAGEGEGRGRQQSGRRQRGGRGRGREWRQWVRHAKGQGRCPVTTRYQDRVWWKHCNRGDSSCFMLKSRQQVL